MIFSRMSIASGMQPATSGEMTYRGKPWHPHNMIESQHEGISMILQEANTIPGVTVAQNLFAGREAEFSKFGDLLEKAKKNIDSASATIEQLQGTRTKAIKRKLREVEALPADQAAALLPGVSGEGVGDEECS